MSRKASATSLAVGEPVTGPVTGVEFRMGVALLDMDEMAGVKYEDVEDDLEGDRVN